MFKKLNKKNNKGFTLVELLVVIAIIGILAVVAVPSLFKNINKAHAADAVSYISAYRTAAIAEYSADPVGMVGTTLSSAAATSVEGKPAKAISGAEVGEAGDNMIATFTMTNSAIAEQVIKELGDVASAEDGDTTGTKVVVTLIKKQTT